MLKSAWRKGGWALLLGAPLWWSGADVQAAPPAAAASEENDPWAVPPQGTAADYLEFIQELQRRRPSVRTREEFMEHMKNSQTAVSAAAEKALADPDIGEEQAVAAMRAQFSALTQLQRLGDVAAELRLATSIAAWAKDARPAVSKSGQKMQLQHSVATLGNAAPEERRRVAGQLLTMLKEEGITGENFSPALRAGQALEQAAPQEAGEYYTQLAALAGKSDHPQIAAYGEKLQGVARRVNLLGNAMQVSGTLLDGDELDWDSYRGKVVLVDFWATWCGPCIAELPNIKKNYEQYHEKGFDVIGISLDGADDQDKVTKFLKEREIPWPTLFSSKEGEAAWDHPMASRYGILGIPTAILVDQQGKVVDLHARGPALGEKLAELLGPADAKPAGD